MTTSIPILLYHSVDTRVAPKFQTYSVTPAQLDTHLKYLVENLYSPMTVTQLVTALNQADVSLPDKPVVITFDDGFLDFYENALPILSKYQVPATLYITTGYIGKTSQWLCTVGEGQRPMLEWEHVVDIQASGVECGGHTHTHPELDTIPLAQAQSEIVQSKQVLEDKLGQAVPSFAYPHGCFTPRVRQFVQEAGYSSACGVKHAMSSSEDDQFSLSRIVITDKTDTKTLDCYLKCTHLAVAPTRRALRTRVWRWYRWSKFQVMGRPCLDAVN